MGGCSGAGRVEKKRGSRRWRAENPSVSTSPGESDEPALLKGPGSAKLIRQKWKEFDRKHNHTQCN